MVAMFSRSLLNKVLPEFKKSPKIKASIATPTMVINRAPWLRIFCKLAIIISVVLNFFDFANAYEPKSVQRYYFFLICANLFANLYWFSYFCLPFRINRFTTFDNKHPSSPFTKSNKYAFLSIFLLKNLRISKKSSTFALAFEKKSENQ